MFKNLRSLFFVEEEGGPEKPQNKKEGPKSTAGKSSGPLVSRPVEGTSGKVSIKFMDLLFNSMEQNNIEGFDYLEYKQSLQSLKKMPMDEPTRYQSAYAMAQTMGASPAHLIDTARHYIDILKKEEEKFAEALANQQLKQIESKEQEIGKIEQLIKTKTEQIKKLTQEIELHRNKAGQMRKQISAAAVKVETTKNNFIASYNSLVGQIHQDVENMKKYLK